MTERRQSSRREPIEIETSDKKVHIAVPLPWQKANDLGNEIVRQNAETANEAVRMYVTDEGLPQLEMKLKQKISNWGSVLVLAYLETKPEDYDKYDIDECSQLTMASLEVNHLEHLRHLVDPNFQPPTSNGGINSSPSGEEALGQKIESILPSSSEGSPENQHSLSLVESS